MKQLFLAAALFVTSSALAADLDLWIGFTGVQTSGQVKYVNSMIGSNEDPNSPAPHKIYTLLSAAGSDGTTLCTVTIESTMVVKPGITPLQFRLTYPNITMCRGTRKYTLYGWFRGGDDDVPEPTGSNNFHVWTVDFPCGGTPSCVKLLN